MSWPTVEPTWLALHGTPTHHIYGLVVGLPHPSTTGPVAWYPSPGAPWGGTPAMSPYHDPPQIDSGPRPSCPVQRSTNTRLKSRQRRSGRGPARLPSLPPRHRPSRPQRLALGLDVSCRPVSKEHVLFCPLFVGLDPAVFAGNRLQGCAVGLPGLRPMYPGQFRSVGHRGPQSVRIRRCASASVMVPAHTCRRREFSAWSLSCAPGYASGHMLRESRGAPPSSSGIR